MPSKELRHAIALEDELAGLIDAGPTPAQARAAMREATMARVSKTVPDDVYVTTVDEQGVRGEWIGTRQDAEGRIVVLVHGGAFTYGSAEEVRELAGRLARATQARVFSVDYRQAPEHPFPAALDDVVGAFRWLVTGGADPREVAIAGESTGGTLALGAAIALRDAGGPLPGALALMSPVTDLAPAGDPTADPTGAWRVLQAHLAAYAGGAEPGAAGLSPGKAALAGLPAAIVQVGTADPVLEEVRAFVEDALAAGVDVTYSEWDGMIHSWQRYPHIYDAGRASNQIGDFLLQRIGPGYVPVARTTA